MDPFIRTALDRAADRARGLPPGRQRPAPRPLAAAGRHLPQLRQGRARRSPRTGTARRSPSHASPDLVDWADRLRLDRAASRRSAATRSCPGTSSGRRSGACSASRSSPTARTSRRPAGRATGRDAIAREVFEREPPLQLPVRVPQHRRPQDVDLEGTRRRRPHDRRGRSRPSSCASCSSASARRARSSSTPRAPTRSRACSTSSTGSPPPPRAARSRASCRRASTRSSATRCSTRTADVDAAAAAFRPAFAPPRAARPDPGRRRPRRASRRRRGAPLTDDEAAEFEVRLARRRAAGSRRTRPSAPGSRSSATRCRSRSSCLRPEQRGFLRALADVRPRRRAGDAASSGRPRSSPSPRTTASTRRPRSTRSTSRSSGGPNGPRAGWLLASLERDFVIRRLTEAGAAGEAIA